MPRSPLHWDITKSYRDNFETVEGTMQAYTDATGVVFDEASILTMNTWSAKDVSHYLQANGWELFNEARDHVEVEPFGTAYEVHYLFLRHPDMPWRMEVMHPGDDGNLLRGGSPLHTALVLGDSRVQYNHTAFAMPHFSYKPEDAYEVECHRLQYETSVTLAQACQSTYGRFSYWHNPHIVSEQVYLKPRVNTRDERQPLPGLLGQLEKNRAHGTFVVPGDPA